MRDGVYDREIDAIENNNNKVYLRYDTVQAWEVGVIILSGDGCPSCMRGWVADWFRRTVCVVHTHGGLLMVGAGRSRIQK